MAVRGKFFFLGSLSPPAGGALPLGPSACETPQKKEFSPDSSGINLQKIFSVNLNTEDSRQAKKLSQQALVDPTFSVYFENGV